MRNFSLFLILCLVSAVPAHPQEGEILLAACDLCLPTSSVGRPVENLFEPGLQVGLQHQYTRFGELTVDGRKVDNTFNERLNGNTTQLHFTYNFDPRVGVQLSIPYHHRSYRRQGAAGREEGTVSGLGDIVLRGRFAPVRQFSDKQTLVWTVDLGMKLPTGSSSLLRPPAPPAAPPQAETHDHEHHDEEEHEHHRSGVLAHAGHDHGSEHAGAPRAAAPAPYHSPVGDHDLALGSGSVDGIVGTNLFYSGGDFYANGGVQYFSRSEGSHGYRFGDVLHWKVAPGYLLVNDEHQVVGLQLNLSGEHHDPHRENGVRSHHGYTDIIYLGPEVMAVQGDHLSLAAGVDLPVGFHSEGLQLAPEYRLRMHLNWRF